MSSYDPDYVYMIPLNFKTKHTYFEDITTIPARIRGAFIVNEEKKIILTLKLLVQDLMLFTEIRPMNVYLI